MLLLRSVLFVPGDSEKKIAKSLGIAADLPVFDLEDSVMPERRAAARRLVADALVETRGRQRAVRINALDTPDALDDLAAIVAAAPDLVMLPKIESVADVNALAGHLDALERKHDLEPGRIKIIAVGTETPRALFTLDGLQEANDRLVALTWGAEDLSTALGAMTNKDESGNWTFPYQLARGQCLLAARAAGLAPIDTLHADFRDAEGLRVSCLEGRRDGFTGKLAIHPAQVDVINECFSPNAEEVEFARKVVATFDANPDKGVVQIDGKMFDIPHLKRAQDVLAQHALFEKSD